MPAHVAAAHEAAAAAAASSSTGGSSSSSSSSSRWWRYSLTAVVEHQGSSTGYGHYVAYVRRPVLASTHSLSTEDKCDDKVCIASSNNSNQKALGDQDTLDQSSGARKGGEGLQEAGNSQAASASGEAVQQAVQQQYKWFHVSDTSVREVTEAAVLASQAYILLYLRD